MAKGWNLFKTALFSAATAAAVTAFLRSESGKKAKKSVTQFAKDYQADPAAKREELLQKAQAYGAQAYSKATALKEQFASGELTVDVLVEAGKSKANDLRDQSVVKMDDIKEKIASQNLSTKDLIASIKEKAARLSSQEDQAEESLIEGEESVEETEVITIELPEAPVEEDGAKDENSDEESVQETDTQEEK